jgi:hypothetical protein
MPARGELAGELRAESRRGAGHECGAGCHGNSIRLASATSE